MTLEDFVRRGQAAQAAVDDLTGKALTDDDRARLAAILDAHDPVELANLIYGYYRDADRADRTSRSQMYLHLGCWPGPSFARGTPSGGRGKAIDESTHPDHSREIAFS